MIHSELPFLSFAAPGLLRAQSSSSDHFKVRVVLFSGGRGSRVLSRRLINHPRVALTLAINGYDDGSSTGEVRRFMGDSLGPSDFRKNASWLARELRSCRPELIDLLDLRFHIGCSTEEALRAFRLVEGQSVPAMGEFQASLSRLLDRADEDSKRALARKLLRFEHELVESGRPFSFSDCSLGNLAFAGCFLDVGRNFNAAISDYCALLNLPEGLIENVTDGENACLVALDHDQRLLGSEADIVNANRRNHIKDIYLIDRPLTVQERERLANASEDEIASFLQRRAKVPAPNPRLLERIAEADLIIYSPGTQHSSLFPSYLTPGLGPAIAQNLTAIKLLITNLREDAEIPDSSAVDIIRKATYYLKERDAQPIPTPCLITHYLLNDHGEMSSEIPYVPLGRLESLEDPRLLRIGNYEEGGTGRHDAAKVLLPFIEAILRSGERRELAIWLLDTESLNKICQTILEMIRGGIGLLPFSISIFYHSRESFDPAFTGSLPFEVRNVAIAGESVTAAFFKAIAGRRFDYIVLFDSSGMYQGEDIVNVISLLTNRRLDAVWGSRRLSVKDIHESYKLRYRRNLALGAISYLGSHLLSLAYLSLYGRYISDTLSGVRALRAPYALASDLDLTHPCLNQYLLSSLLGARAEVFETPVRFFPLAPERVRRTTILDGLQALLTVLRRRFKSRKRRSGQCELAGNYSQSGFPERDLAGQPND